jgi:predicted metal-dependent peptidase
MSDKNLKAQDKVSKARAKLVLNEPFFGALILKMDVIETNRVPTAGVDGVHLFYNPAFIDTMTLNQCKGLLAHEVMHVALKHMTRRGDRNPLRWNIADDFVIDPILVDCGFELPKGAHVDPKYDGMWAEKVYDLLPEDIGKGGGQCDGDCANCQVQIQAGPPNPNLPASMCPNIDPNGNGAVYDAPVNLKDQAQKQQFEEAVNIAVEQAAKTALMAGNMPGALKRFVDSIGKQKVDWRNTLREYLEITMERDDRTWMRPNRRFADWDVLMPGFDQAFETPKIIFVADTSGSISGNDLAYFGTEVSAVLSEFPSLETLVYYIDTKVYAPQVVSSEDLPLKLDAKGGGGTDFEDFFEKVPNLHKHDDIKCYIFFTDLYTNSFGKDPGIPVLWLCHEKSKHDSEVPFGHIIPVTID